MRIGKGHFLGNTPSRTGEDYEKDRIYFADHRNAICVLWMFQ